MREREVKEYKTRVNYSRKRQGVKDQRGYKTEMNGPDQLFRLKSSRLCRNRRFTRIQRNRAYRYSRVASAIISDRDKFGFNGIVSLRRKRTVISRIHFLPNFLRIITQCVYFHSREYAKRLSTFLNSVSIIIRYFTQYNTRLMRALMSY